MTRHRTTARGVLFLTFAIGLAAASAAAWASSTNNGTIGKHHKRIIFPLLGSPLVTDQFGDPRPIGTEQGTDIMMPRHSPALAAEAGTVKFADEGGAGCVLYLYGKSKTTYEYIHLNNDKTSHNDNGGKCKPGISYARNLHDGSRVQAGQIVAFTGDSGNASGIPHLEFQLRPHDGNPIDPYRYLKKGRHLLFGTFGKTVKLALVGKVGKVEGQFLTLKVRAIVVNPGKLRVTNVRRKLTVYVPVDAVIAEKVKGRATTATVSLAAAKKDRALTVTTIKEQASLGLMRGQPNTLTAKKVLLAARSKRR